MAPPGSPAPQPDLRTQLAALLAGSQPRSNDAGPRRRKPHPLYSSGSAAAAASGGKRTCGAASQAGSARRSKSQPASPKGVTKVSPPRLSIVASAARRTQPRGGWRAPC